MIGEYGDIIPSFLNSEAIDPSVNLDDFFRDTELHMGEVQSIVYPTDEFSRSKKFIEYDVYVQFQRGSDAGVGKMYSGCVLLNLFAGLADKLFWSLRPSNSASDFKNKQLGLGSKVLILCINGNVSFPLIIGGIRNEQEDPKQEIDWSKNGTNNEPGRYFFFEFNGIKIYINNDGELSLSYNGRTDNDGKKDKNIPDADVGTTLSFEKTGNFLLKTKDNEQNFNVNHKDKKITFKYKNAFEIGKATDAPILGTTYRNNEKEMHTKMMTSLNALTTLFNTIGSQLQTAGVALAANNAPGAATPVNAAAAAALSAAGQMTQLKEAINAFENNSNKYLSPKILID